MQKYCYVERTTGNKRNSEEGRGEDNQRSSEQGKGEEGRGEEGRGEEATTRYHIVV